MIKDSLNPGTNNLSDSMLSKQQEFEQLYLALRKKENRMYTDAELARLPDIGKEHFYYKEWLIRKNSLNKLSKYLRQKNKSLEILEVGCGNGWLSNQLSLNVHCQVTGLDINKVELDQAARVFRQNTECNFLYGNLDSGVLNGKKFDVIVFAASLQYFQYSKDILNVAERFLKSGGEIHITDTHFYKDLELEEARQRSKSHFNSLGFLGMSTMYFHHSLNDLKDFHPSVLNDPFSFKNRFISKNPFYWLCIKKG